MKQGWQTKTLNDIAYLAGRIGWKGLTAKEYTKEGPFFLSVHSLNHGDFVDFRDAFHISQARYDESPEIMLEQDDILICKDGAGIGKLGIVREVPAPTTINSSLLLIRSNGDVVPKYLYYKLCSPFFQRIVQDRIDGATTPHLYQREIKRFPIFVAPPSEQKRIVAILDEAFEGIDRAIANTEKNLANARELFESQLNIVFSNARASWAEREIGSLSERITKGSSPKWQGISYVEKPGILFITSENVGVNRIILDKKKYVEEAFNEKDKKSILQRGDVLTNIVGASIGRTAVFNSDELANINQAVCLIRPNGDLLSGRYLTYLLNSPFFKRILHENEIDNARANLSLGFFRTLRIPAPDVSIQSKIVSELDDLQDAVRKLEDTYRVKLDQIVKLKQSILQKAFAGELTKSVLRPPVATRLDIQAPKPCDEELSALVTAFAHDMHERAQRNKTFGRVKAQKVLHLTESLGGIELGRQPVKRAAGPHDEKHMCAMEDWAKANGLFEFRPRSNGRGYTFHKLDRYGECIRSTTLNDHVDTNKLANVVELLVPMDTEEAEVFATVHAAWSNLVLDGKEISTDVIIFEARDNWHPDKLKIPNSKFDKAISFIRSKSIEPDGRSKRVGGQERLI